MRGDELLDKMGLVDPEFVIDAETIVPCRKNTWLKAVAAAACLCLAMLGLLTLTTDKADVTLQPISIPELSGGGMGFEGYMVFEPEELDNGNPWRADMELETLPVYKNLAYDPTGAGFPKGLSEEEMRERLLDTAKSLGLEMISEEVIADGMELVDGLMVESDAS